MLKRCYFYSAHDNISNNSKPITSANLYNILAEMDKDEEKLNTEDKITEIQDSKEAQGLKDKIIVFKEYFSTELVTVETLERLVNDLNHEHANI